MAGTHLKITDILLDDTRLKHAVTDPTSLRFGLLYFAQNCPLCSE